MARTPLRSASPRVSPGAPCSRMWRWTKASISGIPARSAARAPRGPSTRAAPRPRAAFAVRSKKRLRLMACMSRDYKQLYTPELGGFMAKRSTPTTRLDTPLVRDHGILRPATWDEALDRAADGFRSAVAKKGPQTFGLFSCSKTTNEMNFLAQKFARTVIGSNNIDSCNRT